jgi:hypothetical protein
MQDNEGQKAYMCIGYTSDNRCSDISLLALLTGMSATELPTQCTSAEPVDC